MDFPLCVCHHGDDGRLFMYYVMKIEINGKEIVVEGDSITIGDLLSNCGIDGKGRAAAVGNRVVPKREWQEFIVEDGMKVTVIKAVCGG